MSFRKHKGTVSRAVTKHALLAVGATSAALLQTPATAAAGDWTGSYWAEGQCYCTESIDPAVAGRIVPTPVGGKTVAQICQEIGRGPGLELEGERFNFPAYRDPQCGNGPFVPGSEPDASCAGTLTLDGSECQPARPARDLAALYGVDKSAAETRHTTSSWALITPSLGASRAADDASADASADVKRGARSRQTDATPVRRPEVSKAPGGKSLLATVASSALKAVHVSDTDGKASHSGKAGNSSRSLSIDENFTGKQIVIGGQRYLQAHPDVPPTGGRPGSRILVDDIVFLKDDGSIDPADLYKGSEASTPTTKRKAAAERISSRQSDTASSSGKTAASKAIPSRTRLPRQTEWEVRSTTSRMIDAAKDEMVDADGSDKPDELADADVGDKPDGLVDADGSSKADELADVDSIDKADELVDADGGDKADELADADGSDMADELADAEPSVEDTSAADADKRARGGVSIASALRLPEGVRQSSREFSYVEAMPTSYDYGGNGVEIEGSVGSEERYHFIGRAAIVSDYQEVMLGAGFHLTPVNASRMTAVLTAGIEYGNFEISNEALTTGSIEYSDSGAFLALSSRMVMSPRFELQGGVGYSSFFEGDLTAFGRGSYHLNRQLDFVSRFEVGDNDSIGFGLRFYY
ncbi:MAG: hypothetical protein CSB44_08590 [Gammaproteobacteria bacterium]|nr:MAG: hypothetical protein CSB44_08590 [Gammaproteobacteria bacterium]